MNEASRPGRPLYERFVAAWRRVPDKSMRLVYHATEEKNYAAILRDGLDPRRRGGKNGRMGGTGEYFGKTVRASAFYGDRGSRKMLIFALLVDRSGVVSEDRAHKGEICVDKIDHQLPIAVVTRSTSSRTPAYWTGCRSARSARQPLEPNPV
mmetsp:Transcript_25519/g.76921  ORF Transcript_25519/g.76921 Transcript_25519/m.76921 type:complete len:152 (+) Transcript_25519:1706-2161(+)